MYTRSCIWFVFVVMGALGSLAPADAQTLYVDNAAPLGGDGSSWTTPYKYLQDALNDPGVFSEIRVGGGAQRADLDEGGNVTAGDPAATLQLVSSVALRGGYAGYGAPTPDTRDVSLYETILNGDLNGDDGPNFTNYVDNTDYLVTVTAASSTTLLDGFSLAASDTRAIDNQSGSPTISNCQLRLNRSTAAGNYLVSGTVYDTCTFTGNGTGMAVTDSTVTVEGCVFRGNGTTPTGGTGGILVQSNSTLHISYSSFIANQGSKAAIETGELFNAGNTVYAANCRFMGNTGTYGGAVFAGSGNTWTIVNSVFIGNTALEHGGAIRDVSDVYLYNCTLAYNTAYGRGGGIYSYLDHRAFLYNCIVWGNTDMSGAGPTSQIANAEEDLHTFAYDCCIDGGHLWGGTNLEVEPSFVDADGPDDAHGTEDDDLRLSAGSLCLDVGDDATLPPDVLDLDDDGDTTEALPVDLEGNPRVANGTVDLGAFEGPKQVFAISGEPAAVPEGSTAQFTVALALDPLGPVNATVSAYSGDPDITITGGASLFFDSFNYSTPQAVTLSAGEDADNLNGDAILRVSAAGIPSRNVGAEEDDDETVPALLFVDATLDASGDGASWAGAYSELRDALAFAAATGGKVSSIWVAAGTYTPEVPAGIRTKSFELLDGLALYGGFMGGETSLEERDWNTNVTILSGDLNGDDNSGGDNTENSRQVVRAVDVNGSALLDGFTISGGNGEGGPPYSPPAGSAGALPGFCGGGIYVQAASPRVANCVITANGGHNGGGVYNVRGSAPKLRDCVLSQNLALNWLADGRSRRGGAMASYESMPILRRCSITGHGFRDAIHGEFSDSLLIECEFTQNTTVPFSDYAGVSALVNCVFAGNGKPGGGTGGEAGGIHSLGEEQLPFTPSNLNVVNSIFTGNIGLVGGIRAVESVTTLVINSTFAGNSRFGMKVEDFVLLNSVLWGNGGSNQGDQVSVSSNGFGETIDHCCIMGWDGTYASTGTGNLALDPLFVDDDGPDNVVGTLDDNLGLRLRSPCIDAGDNLNLPVDTYDLDRDGNMLELLPLDLDRLPRIGAARGRSGPPWDVDMGAYERYGPKLWNTGGSRTPQSVTTFE